MNVTSLITVDYENKWQRTLGENEPNTNPIKANLLDAQMNVNSLITKDYRKKDDFAVQKNEPNTDPIKLEAEFPTGGFLGILKPGTNFKRAQILLPPQVATGDLVKILYIVIGSLWRMDYNHRSGKKRHAGLALLETCTGTTPVAAGELLLTGQVRKGVTAV